MLKDACSYRHNNHYRFSSLGLGFYVENDSHFKGCIEDEEKCHHKYLWKRKEGWTQCRDCYKIIKTNRSLQKELRFFRADKVRRKTNEAQKYFHISKPDVYIPIINSIEVDVEEKSFKEKMEEIGNRIISNPMPNVSVFGTPHSSISIIPDIEK